MLNQKQNAVVKQWYETNKKVSEAKEAMKDNIDLERKLRTEVVSFFPVVVEGSKNQLDLGGGYALKVKQGYTRKVDTAAVVESAEKMRELHIPVDMLYKVKYELDMAIYRKLTEEQRKVVDETFTLTHDTPQVELQAPKAQ